ncbi:MAG: FAD-dependent oxidoreductase, partial [Oscillospiraceae bacterium]|nr:FAD-dependent oxidoreductase [Oscillospiraceae bacterium]
MEYLWTKGVEPPRFPALEGDLRTGVLVIGGGMAGVLCLRQLRDRGVDCVLAEGNRIGMGITKGTTAVLSAQHDVLYSDLIRRRGADQAKRYLEANLRAVEGFRELSRTIPCDFQDMPSVMYSLTERDVLEQEARAVRSLG